MKRQNIFLAIAALMLIVVYLIYASTRFESVAYAQTPIIDSGDLKRGVLNWTWTEGTDKATQLRLKCRPDGTPVGQYTFQRTITPVAPTGTIPLIDVLPSSGKYYCVFVGAAPIPGVTPTVWVEGVASSEYPFAAGVGPSGSGKIWVTFQ